MVDLHPHPDRLLINIGNITACAPNWSWSTAGLSWTDLDLWVVLDGVGHMETPEGRVELSRGSALLLRGGEVYEGYQDPRRRLVVSFTHFDFLDEQGAVLPWQNLLQRDCLPGLFRQMTDVVRLEGNLRSLDNARQSGANSSAARLWLAACLLAVQEQDRHDQADAVYNDLDRTIDACCAALREDPLRWRTVADLAQFCHCSPDYFTRRFKARRQVSPAQFLTDVRMEHARVMLRYTTMSAGQIAEAIGYGDPAYFNRVFTRQHTMPPHRWRLQFADSI